MIRVRYRGYHSNNFSLPYIIQGLPRPDAFFKPKQRTMIATYRYQDYWTKQRYSCRCLVEDRTGKSVLIRLLEFGPNGRPPGTRMRVRRKSLDLPEEKPVQTELNWHDWTDI